MSKGPEGRTEFCREPHREGTLTRAGPEAPSSQLGWASLTGSLLGVGGQERVPIASGCSDLILKSNL